jgi:hypothetical protein
MDPSFVFLAANLMREKQLANIGAQQASYEESEAEKKQNLSKKQHEILETFRNESTDILHLVSVNPEKAFVRAQIALSVLDSWKVIPDSFEQLKEKEQAQLVWRKLLNISEKCKKQLSSEMLDNSKKCLNAVSMEHFLRVAAKRLNAYQKYLELGRKIDSYKSIRKKVDRDFILISIAIVIISLFLSIWLQIVFGVLSNPVWTGITIALMSILELTVGMILMRRLPKDISQITQMRTQYSQEAGLDDSGFWENVKAIFGTIPSDEQLLQKWEEQEAIIQPYFKETDTEEAVTH